MSEIQIDKNVPIPNIFGLEGRAAKYPWRQLDVGDSFFVPGAKANLFGGCASGAAKRTGFKFKTRTVDGGVRVWRVE